MRRRITLIAVALLLALFGTAMIFNYSAGRPAPAAAAEKQATVLVATKLIPAGTTGRQALEQKLIALKKVPARVVPPGALVDIAPVQDQETANDLQPGEMLLPARFLDTTVAGSMDIPDDKVAISVQVADPQRVAGFVRPGSEVAVFATYPVTPPAPPTDSTVPVVAEATKVLLPRVKVVAVGPTALRVHGTAEKDNKATAAPTTDTAALVTLAVSIEDAQKLAHTALTGRLTLGLLNKDSRTGVVPADDNRSLFG